jgi:large repetitive protein
LTNDSNPDGDTLTATQLLPPAHGSLTLNEDGSFTYDPDDGFTGTDSFTYGVSDGRATDTAIVTLTVGDPIAPVPGYDSFGTAVNTPLAVGPTELLSNDLSVSGNALSATVIQGPQNGQLQFNPDGSFTYTPHTGFSGVDEFQYAVNDGQTTSAPAVVTIAVGVPANTAPHTMADDLITAGNTPLTISHADLVGNDGDNDLDGLTAYVISQPANGTVVNNNDGTFTYTPNPNFRGNDTFYYTAFDGQADSIPTVVTISVDPL